MYNFSANKMRKYNLAQFTAISWGLRSIPKLEGEGHNRSKEQAASWLPLARAQRRVILYNGQPSALQDQPGNYSFIFFLSCNQLRGKEKGLYQWTHKRLTLSKNNLITILILSGRTMNVSPYPWALHMVN